MRSRGSLAGTIATVMLAGPWTRAAIGRRVGKAFGKPSRVRAKRIVAEAFERIATPYAPQWKQLERIVADCQSLADVSEATAERLFALTIAMPTAFAPIPALAATRARPLAAEGDLARWLDIPLRELGWFADERRTLRHAGDGDLQHYDRVWVPKKNGRWRLIEAPKARTKEIQRSILRDILDHTSPHDAAFAFRKSRTAASAAAKHAGEHVVVTVDLKDFFLSVRAPRVHAVFRSLGYPLAIARMLTALCTTETPAATLAQHPGGWSGDWMEQMIYRGPHLPQGAPTSPALANLAARRLDCRLAGLARRFDARYTRYADDLTFSGDTEFHRKVAGFLRAIAHIAADEGFALNATKTRVMPQRMRQVVTGLVVNDHINVPRDAYDALKATLTNCMRKGPVAQNRERHADFRAHLDGRIAWVESVNLRRGEKLRRIFEDISW